MSNHPDSLDPAGAIRAALRHADAAHDHLDKADALNPTFEHNRSTQHVLIARAQVEVQQATMCVLLDIAASLRAIALANPNVSVRVGA